MTARRLPPVLVTTLAFLALHMVLAALVPLIQDEAYYALWATHPALDYYDHPGMIAWMIRAGEALLGKTEAGVRLLPVLCYALATPMAARMAALATGLEADKERTARLAALFFNATVLTAAMGFTATPDAPSVLFWTAASWALFEALHGHDDTAVGRWWLLAGLFAGLGVQSKLTNLFLGVGLVLWLVLTAEGRRWLRRPAVWGAFGVVALVVAPLIGWNALHGWAGLTRQTGRLEDNGRDLGQVAAYLVSTVIVVSPLILWAAGRGLGRLQGPARLLRWLVLPLALYMLYHASHAKVQANWLAPLYPSLGVLAALHATRLRDRFALAAVALGLGTAAAALAVTLWPGTVLIPGRNPPNQTKGWPAFTARIEAEAHAAGARWIAAEDYGTTGSLAFYLPPALPVWGTSEQIRYLFRGPFPRELCDAPGLFIRHARSPARAARLFARHGTPVAIARRAGPAVVSRYVVTPVRGAARVFASCAQ